MGGYELLTSHGSLYFFRVYFQVYVNSGWLPLKPARRAVCEIGWHGIAAVMPSRCEKLSGRELDGFADASVDANPNQTPDPVCECRLVAHSSEWSTIAADCLVNSLARLR